MSHFVNYQKLLSPTTEMGMTDIRFVHKENWFPLLRTPFPMNWDWKHSLVVCVWIVECSDQNVLRFGGLRMWEKLVSGKRHFEYLILLLMQNYYPWSKYD